MPNNKNAFKREDAKWSDHLAWYYEKVITEEERLLKEKQINTLKANIERRTKLLNNSGYVNKAPKELVESEKAKLAEEKDLLASLMQE